MADRPYLFFELTNSLCSTCLRKVEAKVIFQNDCVYLLKHCPEHGHEKVLISTDIAFYKMQRAFLKPGQLVKTFNTPVQYGCPYDCGICTDHEQHGCVSVVEITDFCNLTCPICYAESSPQRLKHRSFEHVQFMLDCVVRNEGEPDVVQISGGEPTLHPDFFRILDAAKARPIKHLMVNTNGIRIAEDPAFAKRLKDYMPDFEIYLQFDSLQATALHALRGADLQRIRLKAIEQLNKHEISTTLVVTLKKGLNDDEIGQLIDFALQQPCVRGITFQPIQVAGRVESFNPATDRLTLAEVRQNILRQSSIFQPEDLIPVPCHPDSIAMAYALKIDGKVIPLTRMIDPQILLGTAANTIVYERCDTVREHVFKLFSSANSPVSSSFSLQQLLCCLPSVFVPNELSYKNLFRIIIMQFMDAYNFDVRSVKRACVHIVHPDGRLIPFDTFNLFYREGKEALLKTLQAEYAFKQQFSHGASSNE
jgi:uncharacterized radical SAM superfamily Fe-S cluster-containing enzyme